MNVTSMGKLCYSLRLYIPATLWSRTSVSGTELLPQTTREGALEGVVLFISVNVELEACTVCPLSKIGPKLECREIRKSPREKKVTKNRTEITRVSRAAKTIYRTSDSNRNMGGTRLAAKLFPVI